MKLEPRLDPFERFSAMAFEKMYAKPDTDLAIAISRDALEFFLQ